MISETLIFTLGPVHIFLWQKICAQTKTFNALSVLKMRPCTLSKGDLYESFTIYNLESFVNVTFNNTPLLNLEAIVLRGKCALLFTTIGQKVDNSPISFIEFAHSNYR